MKKIFLLSLVIFLSCKKTNINDHSDWVGTWEGFSSDAVIVIKIQEDGNSTYAKSTGISNVTATGRFLLKGDLLKIGVKKIKVNQSPSAATLSMPSTVILDDVTCLKQ